MKSYCNKSCCIQGPQAQATQKQGHVGNWKSLYFDHNFAVIRATRRYKNSQKFTFVIKTEKLRHGAD